MHAGAGDRDDAVRQRATLRSACSGMRSADVVHQHTDVGRVLTQRDLQAGQHFDQLPLATLRIATGQAMQAHRHGIRHRHFVKRCLQRCQRTRHVGFQRDIDTQCAAGTSEDLRAKQHIGRFLDQQSVVTTDPGLTLRAVEDQRLDRDAELVGAGEIRATKTADASPSQTRLDCLTCHVLPVERRCLDAVDAVHTQKNVQS
ncbi:MAG: hypothetical protein BWZ07_02185 [Alphaproteobacteria bacterium ADurb.BinA280]|nr:MAG: hypothetical protein BWZ07_02185 [Alphaproteobacteria bacterium ADurb.BinA280]